MIQINLQWCAIPCIFWAIWKLILAIKTLIQTWNMSDFGRLIGFYVAIHSFVHIVVSLGLAFLFWRAFR